MDDDRSARFSKTIERFFENRHTGVNGLDFSNPRSPPRVQIVFVGGVVEEAVRGAEALFARNNSVNRVNHHRTRTLPLGVRRTRQSRSPSEWGVRRRVTPILLVRRSGGGVQWNEKNETLRSAAGAGSVSARRGGGKHPSLFFVRHKKG